jgi:hypothetical protein
MKGIRCHGGGGLNRTMALGRGWEIAKLEEEALESRVWEIESSELLNRNFTRDFAFVERIDDPITLTTDVLDGTNSGLRC